MTAVNDLKPEYMFAEDASKYLMTTTRKIALYRQYGLLKYSKLGKHYTYKKSWCDQFMEEWSGYDLSNEAKIRESINAKNWRTKHAEQ